MPSKSKYAMLCNSSRRIFQIAAGLSLVSLLNGADTVINTDTTITSNHTFAADEEVIYIINDGKSLIFTQAGTSALNGVAFLSTAANVKLGIGPSEPGGTGAAQFKDMISSGNGGALYLSGINNVINLSNVDFNKNRSLTAVGGAVYFNATTGSITLNNVNFAGNAAGAAGAIRTLAPITMTNGSFVGNYADAATGDAGGLQINNAAAIPILTNVLFDSNRAKRNGGAYLVLAAAPTRQVMNNVVFVNNWTGNAGGAICGLHSTGTLEINMSLAGGTNNYYFTGNAAFGNAAGVTLEMLASGSAPTGARADMGGFFYSNAAGALQFNIARDVTLNIGAPAESVKALDSIMSTVTTAKLTKIGQGDLILNADNSYWRGSVAINEGRLLLGNASAKQGGTVITVESGATLGGLGLVATNSQITVVTAKAGSTIQVGLDGATAEQTLSIGTATASGTLILQAGSKLEFDLYKNNKSDLLKPADLVLAGSGTVNIGLLETGSFTLASWLGAGPANASSLALTLSGITGTSARGNGTLSVSGKDLILSTTIKSLQMNWTGASGNIWNVMGPASANWNDSTAVVKNFRTGDSVTFNGLADAANPSNRNIAIASEGVIVSGMTVSGSHDYTFNGGGLTVLAGSMEAGSGFSAAGTLVKNESGRLIFNNGTNSFIDRGILLNAGDIIISKAAHLGGSLGSVLFGSGTGRLIVADNMVFSGSTSAQRVQLGSNQNRFGMYIVADGKTLTIRDASTTSHSGFMFVGANNSFSIGPASAGGSGAVVFQNNSSTLVNAGQGGGVMLVFGTATLTNATLSGNNAVYGGAFTTGDALAVLTLNNAIFANNTATEKGGAINNYLGTANINITNAGTTTYSGNTAGSGGGFLFQGANAIANINVAVESALVIGAHDVAKDTIASANATASINKIGGGALFLTSSNSAYLGTINVTGGGFYLSGPAAALSGVVNASNNATIGGEGLFSGTLSLNNATLSVGVPNSADSQILSINKLTLNNAELQFDIFSGGISDKLILASLAGATGTNTIDINDFVDGSYTIASGQAADIATLDSFAVTVGGALQGGRQSLSTSISSGTNLVLSTLADSSRELTWTGTGVNGSAWDALQANWANPVVNAFAGWDRVLFNDAPGGTDHAITIAGTVVSVSDMIVEGGDNYTFTGAGIAAESGRQIGSIIIGTGKLIKSGSGSLTFDNGANNFKGGIEIFGGEIAFNNGNQLNTGVSAIAFKGDATLRASAADLNLSNNIVIDNGKVATIDTGAHTLTYQGATSGTLGTIAKAGAGTLIYSGDAALGHAVTRIDGGFVYLRNIIAPSSVRHTFDLAGGWLDLSSTPFVSDGSTANDWAQLAFTGSAGGVIGSNDKITLYAGDCAFGIGGSSGKQGVFVVVDAGAGNKARMTGTNYYVGNTRLKSGILQVTGNGQLGLESANREIYLEGGNLEIAGDNFSSNRALFVGNDDGIVIVAADVSPAIWNGVISSTGTGAFVKDGGGELVLTNANAHVRTELRAGTLGVGNAAALGGGVLKVTGENTRLRITTNDVSLANNINLGGHALAIDSENRAASFSGMITNGSLIVYGTGIKQFSGANQLAAFRLTQNAVAVAATANALGGPNVNVMLERGSLLGVGAEGTLAGSIEADGASISFGNLSALPEGRVLLKLAGSLVLKNHSTISLASTVLSSRTYRLVEGTVRDDGTTVFEKGVLNEHIDVFFLTGQDGDIILTSTDISANPGKDIAAAFDAMMASMNSVYSRVSESFLMPVLDRRPGQPDRNFWVKGLGTFADYKGNTDKIGFKDNTYGAIVGYDNILSKKLLLGVYLGCSNSTISTTNQAETKATLPYGGIYGAARFGPLYASADIMLGAMGADTSRWEATGYAVGTYKAFSYGGSVELGMLWDLGRGWTLKPATALHYMKIEYKDQGENGPGAIFIKDFVQDAMENFSSLTMSKRFTFLKKLSGAIDLLAGWRSAFENDPSSMQAGLYSAADVTFNMQGDAYDRSGFVLGIGLRFELARNTAFGLAYDCDMAGDFKRHSFNASIRWAW